MIICSMPGCQTTAGCRCGFAGLQAPETKGAKILRLQREISDRQSELFHLVAGDPIGGVSCPISPFVLNQ